MRLAIFEQLVGLAGTDNIASKQNYAGGLNLAEQRSQARRHLGSVESDNEQLPNIAADFSGGSSV